MRADRKASPSASSPTAAPDPILVARSAAVSGTQDVAGAVTVVGVTWPEGVVTAGDEFQIRTLTGARWSQWQSLDKQSDGPDRAEAATARAATASATMRGTGGTSPYIVTGASKYQVRSLSTDATVPVATKIQVVDPGTSSADSVQPAPGAAAAATATPAIHSRAAWGANESLRKAAPAYGKVALGFVHHTDSGNSYAASDVQAMIRGIYAYHVKSLGWNDIGYNFLVDRFGGIWEGRYGGVTKPVVGAQTMNYNAVSTGVSAIGNFEATAVPSAMTAAFTRILAWKLSLTGLPATGTVLANGKYFNRISGHRDGFPTACPGRSLYAKLPAIRAGAAALIAAQPRTVVTPPVVRRSVINRDVDRNGAADSLSYRPGGGGTSISGPVSVLASAPRQPVRSGVALGAGWNALRTAGLSPDLTGDGKADIVALDPAGDRLRIYLGNGRGGFAGVLYRGRGWNIMTRVIAAGDRNSDRRNDILATTARGELLYYAGDGAGSVRPGRVVGRGWNAIGPIANAGDLTGDSIPDLLATRTSDGVLLMYAGAPDGSVRPGVLWGRGWGQFSALIGGSDLDRDGHPDVNARSGGGIITYYSDSSGRMVRYIRWGSGWDGMSQLSTGADWDGDGAADLLAVRTGTNGGTMTLYAGTGQRDFRTLPAAFPTVPGADLVRVVGDVNGDGYTDAVARVRTNGTLVVLLGLSGSRFATPRLVGTGWNALTLVEAAGDYDGDGVPDLLTRDAAGTLFLYPLNRNLTFKARRAIGAGFQGMQSAAGVGAFNQDAYADVIALRRSDHALLLFRGAGAGPLQGPSVLVPAQNDLVQILGLGDYDGNRTADVLARSGDGRLWLYPGNGLGAVGSRQPLRGGQGAGHVLG
jgi:hypothetical protein